MLKLLTTAACALALAAPVLAQSLPPDVEKKLQDEGRRARGHEAKPERAQPSEQRQDRRNERAADKPSEQRPALTAPREQPRDRPAQAERRESPGEAKQQERAAQAKQQQEHAAEAKQQQERAAQAKQQQERAAEAKQQQERAAQAKQQQERAAEAKQQQERAAQAKQQQERAAEAKQQPERAAQAKQQQERAAEAKQQQERAAQAKQQERAADAERDRNKAAQSGLPNRSATPSAPTPPAASATPSAPPASGQAATTPTPPASGQTATTPSTPPGQTATPPSAAGQGGATAGRTGATSPTGQTAATPPAAGAITSGQTAPTPPVAGRALTATPPGATPPTPPVAGQAGTVTPPVAGQVAPPVPGQPPQQQVGRGRDHDRGQDGRGLSTAEALGVAGLAMAPWLVDRMVQNREPPVIGYAPRYLPPTYYGEYGYGYAPAYGETYGTTNETFIEERYRDSGSQRHASGGGRAVAAPAVVQLSDWRYDEIYKNSWGAAQVMRGHVVSQRGEQLGQVRNVIIGPDERAVSVLVEVDSGGHGAIVNVPWDQVRFQSRESVQVPVSGQDAGRFSLFAEQNNVLAGALAGISQGTSPAQRTWRASDLINDYVTLADGSGYGYVDDVLFDKDGRIQAVVVKRDVAAGGGTYAFPFYGAPHGFDPWLPYYALPYEGKQLADMPQFDEGRLD